MYSLLQHKPKKARPAAGVRDPERCHHRLRRHPFAGEGKSSRSALLLRWAALRLRSFVDTHPVPMVEVFVLHSSPSRAAVISTGH